MDDPVAHIDDINMLSFLDHLRQLAIGGSRQIFFATADTKLAGLFRHKFRFLGDEFKELRLSRTSWEDYATQIAVDPLALPGLWRDWSTIMVNRFHSTSIDANMNSNTTAHSSHSTTSASGPEQLSSTMRKSKPTSSAPESSHWSWPPAVDWFLPFDARKWARGQCT